MSRSFWTARRWHPWSFKEKGTLNTLLLLARLGLFALSLAGWCLWAARRFALPVEQTPLVTI